MFSTLQELGIDFLSFVLFFFFFSSSFLLVFFSSLLHFFFLYFLLETYFFTGYLYSFGSHSDGVLVWL